MSAARGRRERRACARSVEVAVQCGELGLEGAIGPRGTDEPEVEHGSPRVTVRVGAFPPADLVKELPGRLEAKRKEGYFGCGWILCRV